MPTLPFVVRALHGRHSSARKKKKREEIKKVLKSRTKKQKKKPPRQQSKGSPPVARTGQMPDPIQRMQRNQRQDVRRAFLVKTASDHAYVAKCAIMNERTGEVHVDPDSLFSKLEQGGGGYDSSSDSQHRKAGSTPMLPRLFRNSHFEYFSPAAFPDHEPPWGGAPEVAFLGRSTVGKSSLINAHSSMILRGGKGSGQNVAGSGGGVLARTSKRPGRTQTVNYFALIPSDASSTGAPSSGHVNKNGTDANQSKIYLVDLPEIGYASAPGESVDEWQKKTQEFLVARASSDGGATAGIQPWPEHADAKRSRQRGGATHPDRSTNDITSPPLRRLYLLLDSRLSDPTAIDLTVMGWCDECSIPYTIVLTKVDGSSCPNCVKLTNQMCMRFHSLLHRSLMEDEDDDSEEGGGDAVCMDPVVYWTSAKDKEGMEELLQSVENNLFLTGEEDDEEEEEEEDDFHDAELEEYGPFVDAR